MKKPVLVIMAAGMGSRYGGLKQIDPVDEDGHIIIDFSIYDAKRAGFEKVVFIIRREHEEDFRKSIGDRVSKFMEVEYVYQELENLPEGFSVPEGRTKPFGTGHRKVVGFHGSLECGAFCSRFCRRGGCSPGIGEFAKRLGRGGRREERVRVYRETCNL